MNKDSAIYVAGSTGMVGSAIIRCLVQKGYTSIISSKQNWHVNLTNQADVDWYVGNFLPEYIFLAGAKVGGVKANSTYPGDFIYNNLAIQTNVIEAARKYGVKKLLFLGSSCFIAGTLIQTNKGPIPIEEVKEGDQVLTHTGTWQSVKRVHILSDPNEEELITIVPYGSPAITCTRDHRFLTSEGFKTAEDLTVKTQVVIPINRPDKNQKGPLVNSQLAWLVGVFLAEGYTSGEATGKRGSKHTINFSVGKHEKKFIREITQAIEAQFHCKANIFEKRTAIYIYFSDKTAHAFFGKFRYAPQRGMLEMSQVEHWPDYALIHLLRGYWEGDGHVSKVKDRENHQYLATASSVSPRLIWQLRNAIHRLGIFAPIYFVKKDPKTVIEGRTVNQRDQWTLRITGKWAVMFANLILNKQLPVIERRNKPAAELNGDHFLVPIRKIESRPAQKYLYDLSVERDNSYTAYGIAVHNCIYSVKNDGVMRESDLLSGPLEPTNEAYAIAKIAGIKMCQAYHKQYGCNFISVMPTNLFGNNDRYDPETSHVMPAMIKRFHDAKVQNLPEVHCWGTGRPRREFLHVDDCAEACVKLMEEYDNPLEILNIGSGEDMTIEELSLIVASAVGYQGKILFDHDHLDGIYAKRLDPTKIFKLGWKPRITIEDGIKATYADFLERLNNGTLRI